MNLMHVLRDHLIIKEIDGILNEINEIVHTSRKSFAKQCHLESVNANLNKTNGNHKELMEPVRNLLQTLEVSWDP